MPLGKSVSRAKHACIKGVRWHADRRAATKGRSGLGTALLPSHGVSGCYHRRVRSCCGPGGPAAGRCPPRCPAGRAGEAVRHRAPGAGLLARNWASSTPHLPICVQRASVRARVAAPEAPERAPESPRGFPSELLATDGLWERVRGLCRAVQAVGAPPRGAHHGNADARSLRCRPRPAAARADHQGDLAGAGGADRQRAVPGGGRRRSGASLPARADVFSLLARDTGCIEQLYELENQRARRL